DAVRLRRAQARREGHRRRPHRLVQEEPRLLQMPALRGVCRDPENQHRQDSEIQAARDGQGGVNAVRPFAEYLAAFGYFGYTGSISSPRSNSMPRTVSGRRQPRIMPSGLAEEERPFVHDEIVRGIGAGRVKALIGRGVLTAKDV